MDLGLSIEPLHAMIHETHTTLFLPSKKSGVIILNTNTN